MEHQTSVDFLILSFRVVDGMSFFENMFNLLEELLLNLHYGHINIEKFESGKRLAVLLPVESLALLHRLHVEELNHLEVFFSIL